MYIRKGRKQVDIRELLDICIDKNLIDITISSRKSKDEFRVQDIDTDTDWALAEMKYKLLHMS